jgi:hypothetical protein
LCFEQGIVQEYLPICTALLSLCVSVYIELNLAMSGEQATFQEHSDNEQAKRGQDPERTFPSMALSNWIDGVVQWASARNNPNVAPVRPRGVTGFRQAGAWGVNAIGAISFGLSFGDGEVGAKRYDNPTLWEGDAYVTDHGQFVAEVDCYGDVSTRKGNRNGESAEKSSDSNNALPFSLSVSYYFPPGEPFFLESFSIVHSQPTPQPVQLFHFVQSEPNPSSSSCTHNAQYKDGVMSIDETACGQGFYCAAIFPPTMSTTPDGDGRASPSLQPTLSSFSVGPSSGQDSPLAQWAQSGSLNNKSAFQGPSASMGTVTSLGVLQPNETATVVLVHVLRSSESDARDALARALHDAPTHWIKRTRDDYAAWLAKGQQPSGLTGDALRLYRNSLVVMKNSQNPGLGTFVSSFHADYGYKVWARDAIFNAMAMDVAGTLIFLVS